MKWLHFKKATLRALPLFSPHVYTFCIHALQVVCGLLGIWIAPSGRNAGRRGNGAPPVATATVPLCVIRARWEGRFLF